MNENNALKNHILNVASDLFYKKGIKSTGVDAIVKSSEVAKMSFYKYFPSKNDLIKEYLEKDCKVLEYRLRAELQKKIYALKKRLQYLVILPNYLPWKAIVDQLLLMSLLKHQWTLNLLKINP